MGNEKLSQKVKNLRKLKGLSQNELSKNSGLSLRTIQRVENGETEPTGETLKRISSALDVTPNKLIDIQTPKKTVKTKYEYLHIFDNKLVISKTAEINDLVKDYGKSINNLFKTLMMLFISILMFTILTVIFYNKGMVGLSMLSGGWALYSLVTVFQIMLFTSGSSIIRIEDITKIRMQKELYFYYVILISHKESGRQKVRTLVLDKSQVNTMKDTLLTEHLIKEKNIKLKNNKDLIFTFIVMPLIIIMIMNSPISKLFFKDPLMFMGFIILSGSVIFLITIILKLIIPLFNKTTNH